jgi:benzoyl-CoA 2,3-dioxygenase component A
MPVTHDTRNYVVDPPSATAATNCIAPCPTGAIDNWRSVQQSEAYTLEQQLSWDTLPPQQEAGTETASNLPNDVVRITALATSGQGGTAAPPVVGRASLLSISIRSSGRRSRPSPATSG